MIEQQGNKNGSRKPIERVLPVEREDLLTPSAINHTGCPYIGLEDDPSTRLLFASPAACCHRVDPVSAVDLGHQQTHCLTSVHKLCPVFMRPEWGPIPSELEYVDGSETKDKPRLLWFVLMLTLFGLIAVGFWFGWGNGRFPNAEIESSNSAQPVMAAASLPTDTPVPTVVFTKTSTPLPTATATNTVAPTNTPMPTQTAVATATTVATETLVATETATNVPTATLVPTYTPIAPTKTAVPPMMAEVIVSKLNLRAGPSTEYELIATIDEGEQLELVGRLSDSSWWQVCCVSDLAAWVIGEAIEFPDTAEDVVPIVQGVNSLPSVTATLEP